MRAEMSKTPSRAPPSQLHLPAGFRFCPTDEELVVQYLAKKAASQPFSVPIIAEIELYKFDPWDLPDMALFGEKEWYFFSPRDRKYPNGSRPNRAAGSGYWKATGTDKPITSLNGGKKVGVKKALVFYGGKAPRGVKTNWIMHEYRLAETASKPGKKRESLRMDDWVLCRIYKKSSSVPKPAKECSDDDSCLEELLDSLPAIDQSKLTFNIPRIQLPRIVAEQQQFTKASKNVFSEAQKSRFHEEAQRSDRSEMTGVEDEQIPLTEMPVKIEAVETELFLRDVDYSNGISEEFSQGEGSSPELSHQSHENSRKQFSPPESMLEDDSVESTFSSVRSFPSTDRNFTLPLMYGFDSLPSPNLGRFETLSAFNDVDFFNFPQ